MTALGAAPLRGRAPEGGGGAGGLSDPPRCVCRERPGLCGRGAAPAPPGFFRGAGAALREGRGCQPGVRVLRRAGPRGVRGEAAVLRGKFIEGSGGAPPWGWEVRGEPGWGDDPLSAPRELQARGAAVPPLL